MNLRADLADEPPFVRHGARVETAPEGGIDGGGEASQEGRLIDMLARTPARVLIADDHPLVLFALEKLIDSIPNLQVVGRAQTFDQLIDETKRQDFDVVVTDLHMPAPGHRHSIDALRTLRRCCGKAPVIVITTDDDPVTLRRLTGIETAGVLSKRDRLDLIPVAIVSAIAGERYFGPSVRDVLEQPLPESWRRQPVRLLSRREREVVKHFASGLSVTEIAERLGRSVKTISAQKRAAMKKLSLESDVELYRFACESGVVCNPSS